MPLLFLSADVKTAPHCRASRALSTTRFSVHAPISDAPIFDVNEPKCRIHRPVTTIPYNSPVRSHPSYVCLEGVLCPPLQPPQAVLPQFRKSFPKVPVLSAL